MNKLPVVKLKIAFHNQKEVVQILFDRSNELQDVLRANTPMRWSKTMNCWYLPFSKTVKQDLFLVLKNKAYIDYENLKETLIEEKPVIVTQIKKPVINIHQELLTLNEEAIKKLAEFKNWLKSKRYSENTIGTYIDSLTTFLRFYAHKSITEITNNDIIEFNNHYIIANKLSASFQNHSFFHILCKALSTHKTTSVSS